MRSIRTVAAALLSALALAGPASAMPTDPPHGNGEPPVVESSDSSSSFDWTSAAVGAAGGIGAFAIALAAGAGMRHRRPAGGGRVVTH
jgi:hypothetical protein